MPSIFIDFMGNYPVNRVLDYLLTEREIDFSIIDISKNVNVRKIKLRKIWNDLIKNKIIVFNRKLGKNKLYKLNIKDQKVKKLIELDDIFILESFTHYN
ncbi:MAG: hypothetical protein WC413_03970 [Candidatus Nanoarchaeia archaeon]